VVMHQRRLQRGGDENLQIAPADFRSEYLLEITSPCSVMRICAFTLPGGCAKMLGSWGRRRAPTVPPRPWNRRNSTPCFSKHLYQLNFGLCTAPSWREVAPVFIAVGITQQSLSCVLLRLCSSSR